jgi:hypothetical protein
MSRHAILLVNSVDYEDSRLSLPHAVISEITKDFSARLRGLGDHSFQTHLIVNKSLSAARREMDSRLDEIENRVELLLFYYFGHAIAEGNDLLFFFKDSKIHRNTSMMEFREIAEKVSDYRVPRTVFLLDCCYAGTAGIKLAELANQDYFLMASATPKQKALIDYRQKYPIGIFTNEIMRLIGTSEASEFASKEVTFRNVFNHAKARIRASKSGQEPQSRDAGVGDDVFFQVDRRPELRLGLNKEVHPKSLYWKLYKICKYLQGQNFQSIGALHRFALRKNDKSFHTPIKADDGSISYEFVGEASFRKYIHLLRALGAINRNDFELTAGGRTLIQNGGQNYNRLLCGLVSNYWKLKNITSDEIEQMVANRMKSNRFPEVKGLFSDFFFKYDADISRSTFESLIDLTASAGALKVCTDKVYFVH